MESGDNLCMKPVLFLLAASTVGLNVVFDDAAQASNAEKFLIAQRSAFSQQCSFNGVQEGCNLREIRSKSGSYEGTTIIWTSDGKRVDYYFHECNGDHGASYCKVKIIEDNGRVTFGKSAHSGRGTVITSSRGNKTWYPPF